MPKVKIDNQIRLYYRVFRNGNEYRTANENVLASEYLSEKGNVVSVDKPLKSVSGIKVIYLDNDNNCLDAGIPTMILLHGGPGFADHSLYLDFWAKLSDVIQVIMLDQRGNGRSDRGSRSLWNMDTCAEDIVKFCDALNIIKPLIAGVSWGGYVAMRYAIKFPELPGAMILMHTEAKVNSEARQEAFAERAKAHGYTPDQVEEVKTLVQAYDQTPDKPGAREAFMQKCLGIFYAKNPYRPQDLENCVTNIAMREDFATKENLRFDYRQELKKIICPVWYVAGEIDPGHPYQGAQEAAKLIPNAELVILKGLGAPVYRDDPEGIKKLTVEAIQKMLPLLISRK